MRRSGADQTPLNPGLIVSPEQIAEDLAELAKVSQCVRTYSVDNGLDKVPELASKVGLKVLLGIWIGNNRLKNALLIETAISLARDYPGAIKAIIVGNEVLLRGEMTPSDLREIIRSVKTRVNVPVTYADVWEFWLRYREVSDDVDFVTVHILPYWEDSPVRAEDAAAHVDAIRKAGGRCLSRQGNPDRRDRLAKQGTDARRRAAIAHQPGTCHFRDSRSGEAAKTFASICSRPTTRHGSVSGKEPSGGNWGLFDGMQSQAEISARRCHQQLSVLEAADGKRPGIGASRYSQQHG